MANTIIKNNEDLNIFVSNIDTNKTLFAIKAKGGIEVFTNKRSFNKALKLVPNAVNGELTPYNYMWYRF